MHFREGQRGYDVQENIDEIMGDIQGVERLNKSTMSVNSDDIPDKIVTLEPAQ